MRWFWTLGVAVYMFCSPKSFRILEDSRVFSSAHARRPTSGDLQMSVADGRRQRIETGRKLHARDENNAATTTVHTTATTTARYTSGLLLHSC